MEGISDVGIMGPSKFSMRIWLDPAKLAAYGISADAVSAAIANQNIQAAAGSIGTEPAVQTPAAAVQHPGNRAHAEVPKNLKTSFFATTMTAAS